LRGKNCLEGDENDVDVDVDEAEDDSVDEEKAADARFRDTEVWKLQVDRRRRIGNNKLFIAVTER
jgi:hypothetical protein